MTLAFSSSLFLYCSSAMRHICSPAPLRRSHNVGTSSCMLVRLLIVILSPCSASTDCTHTALLFKSFHNQVFNELALPTLPPRVASRREFLKLLLGSIT